MRILFLCGREVSYPLNQNLLKCFRQFSQVDVVAENNAGKSILKRSILVYLQTVPRLIKSRYDLVYIGFYGHILASFVRPITSTPILFHPLISTYETLVFDRKKVGQNSPAARIALSLDHAACRAANHILLDTRANAEYFERLLNISLQKFSVLFVGCDESIFSPLPEPKNSGNLTVLYQGAFLPLHGIDVINEAARLLLPYSTIRFRLYGSGIERRRVEQIVKDQNISNIDFYPPVPVSQMPIYLSQASICLGGHFGTSAKASRVIAGKTFQDIAMGKATIVGDNDANRELLTHGRDAWFCPMDDPRALAESIITLAKDPVLREEIGKNARQTFLERGSLKVICPQVQSLAERVIQAA